MRTRTVAIVVAITNRRTAPEEIECVEEERLTVAVPEIIKSMSCSAWTPKCSRLRVPCLSEGDQKE